MAIDAISMSKVNDPFAHVILFATDRGLMTPENLKARIAEEQRIVRALDPERLAA